MFSTSAWSHFTLYKDSSGTFKEGWQGVTSTHQIPCTEEVTSGDPLPHRGLCSVLCGDLSGKGPEMRACVYTRSWCAPPCRRNSQDAVSACTQQKLREQCDRGACCQCWKIQLHASRHRWRALSGEETCDDTGESVMGDSCLLLPCPTCKAHPYLGAGAALEHRTDSSFSLNLKQ